MKYLLVIASYNDWRQDFFEQYISPRNKEYCKKHGYEYLVSDGGKLFRSNPTWWKFTIPLKLIQEGVLKENDKLVHLDADMAIHKLDEEYPCVKNFSYAIDSGNTHCMGNYAMKINEWSLNLVNMILDEKRYQIFKDIPSVHEYFGYVNSFWSEFREQASWYSLAGIKRHSNEPFWNLPNFGWHSDNINKHWVYYTLKELYENVQIIPTKWNVTEMEGETDGKFLINKVSREDVVIRHFAGGQPWRKEYL